MSRVSVEKDIASEFFCICPGVREERDKTNDFFPICPDARSKHDLINNSSCENTIGIV